VVISIAFVEVFSPNDFTDNGVLTHAWQTSKPTTADQPNNAGGSPPPPTSTTSWHARTITLTTQTPPNHRRTYDSDV
jgi:hypothetical protein